MSVHHLPHTAAVVVARALELVPTLCKAGGLPNGDDCAPLDDADLDAVATCLDWLALVERRKTPNPKRTSYQYKGMVERWAQVYRRPVYIAPGAFLAAAIGSGVTFDRVDVNMRLGLSERSLALLEDEWVPTMADRWGWA